MSHHQPIRLSVIALITSLTLSACGGGGGGDGGDTGGSGGTPVTGSTSSDTASGCLSTAPFTVGYRATLDYQVTESAPGDPDATGTRRNDISVTGTVTINGVQTVRTLEVETFDGTSVERTASYDSLSGLVMTNWRLDNLTGSTVDSVNTYSPGAQYNFGLKAGERSSQTYATTTTFTDGTPATTDTQTETFEFIGLESLSVPAGTFSATCHVRTTITLGGLVSTGDFWLANGTGIPLKSVVQSTVGTATYTRTEVLSSGTANGAAVVP